MQEHHHHMQNESVAMASTVAALVALGLCSQKIALSRHVTGLGKPRRVLAGSLRVA